MIVRQARAIAKVGGQLLLRFMGVNSDDDSSALETRTWVYLGWNPPYMGGARTGMDLGEEGLTVTDLNPPLLIRYKDIEGFEVVPSKQATAFRIFLVGPLLASAWKKMEWFLCIRYRDDLGIQLNLVFVPLVPEMLDSFVEALYEELRRARSQTR